MQPDDPVYAIVAHPNGKQLFCSTKSLVIKVFNLENGRVERTFKVHARVIGFSYSRVYHTQAHRLPVLCMAIDSTGTLLATGSSDSVVKVWDIDKGYQTHNLTGHTGVVLAVAFHPSAGHLQLFSASEDHTARVWDLNTSA